MTSNKQLKVNYHCHTNFCDGNDSAEDMVLSAINKNFDILGISSHTMFPFAEDWHIAPRCHKEYADTISGLKEKYKDKIQLLLGFEADFIPGICSPDFDRLKEFNPDYLIGSVHYVPHPNGIFTIDDSTENVARGLKECFKNNGKRLVQEYFYLERQMLEHCNFTILGHPDLIRKRNGVLKFFNENDGWYKKELKALACCIAKNGCIVEVNTGAINRKIFDDVYPGPYLLELLAQKNVPVVISSDSHNTNDLDGGFDKALQAIKKAGITSTAVISLKDDPALQGPDRTIITMQNL